MLWRNWRGLPKIVNIIAISAIATTTASVSSARVVLANPDDPYNYLPRIRIAFDEFYGKFHHYPKVWYDIEVNCSDNEKLSGCSSILRGPANERKKWNPRGPDGRPSKYTYVIVWSGRTAYRVEVKDRNGKTVFYGNEKQVAIPVK